MQKTDDRVELNLKSCGEGLVVLSDLSPIGNGDGQISPEYFAQAVFQRVAAKEGLLGRPIKQLELGRSKPLENSKLESERHQTSLVRTPERLALRGSDHLVEVLCFECAFAECRRVRIRVSRLLECLIRSVDSPNTTVKNGVNTHELHGSPRLSFPERRGKVTWRIVWPSFH